MSVLDIFKWKQYKADKESLEQQLAELKENFTPEMQDTAKLFELRTQLSHQIETLDTTIQEKQKTITNILKDIDELNGTIAKKKQSVIQLDEEMMLQEFGLYKPRYEFATALGYKQRLENVRSMQKELIKQNRAVTGNTTWAVNGSKSQGTKMVKDMQKLLLRAFNSECDDVIEHVKFNSYEAANKRITASYEAISKLGAIMEVAITPRYFSLKCEELSLALEYREKLHEEKETQKEIRAQMREEAKVAKELEEARKKVEKEKKHYENALEAICKQLSMASTEERNALEDKRKSIQENIDEIHKSLHDIDYREANAKAGYVYVISNIGSFGENVYKIGMTRRLEPYDRVDELGDASVPFDFDVHAMIFSEDAPKLEAALHKAFENKKVNMINTRREFFHVTLDEIKEVVRKNYDKTAEFIDVAEAEQYRKSLKLKKQENSIH